MERSAAVETTRLVRISTVVCTAVAVLLLLGATAAGRPTEGALAALGVLIGASNGHLTKRLLRTGLPAGTTGLLRISALTAVAVVVGLAAGLGRVWLVLLGVAAAQLVMAVSAVVEMSRG